MNDSALSIPQYKWNFVFIHDLTSVPITANSTEESVQRDGNHTK